MTSVDWPVLACVGASLAANAIFPGVGRASNDANIPYTPGRGAFAIWGVIYPALVLYGARQPSPSPPPVVNVLVCAALLLSGVWVYAFTRREGSGLVAAAFILVATAAAALAALALLGPRSTLEGTLALEVPLSLFAGWLALAASLSVSIAAQHVGTQLPASVLWVPVVTASALAVVRKQPYVLAPVLWGVAFVDGKVAPRNSLLVAIVASALLAAWVRYRP